MLSSMGLDSCDDPPSKGGGSPKFTCRIGPEVQAESPIVRNGPLKNHRSLGVKEPY